jgi:hypothetical protein
MPGSGSRGCRRDTWSIGIHGGESPLRLVPLPQAANPVLSRSDVSDVPAGFVADPFMVRHEGVWHMFFEVFNEAAGRGEIGLAQSLDALRWQYRRIVLREPFHLSYPCVFRWRGGHYMVPETLALGAVRLYRAVSFPTVWEPLGTLVVGRHADPTPFRWRGRWWLFLCSRADENDELRLYHAGELAGPWHEHPCSPIVQGNPRAARPGGRVVLRLGRLVRLAQDCRPSYGSAVRAFEITRLTRRDYAEEEAAESPVLAAGAEEWNRAGMHHAEPHRRSAGGWIACVDGCRGEAPVI